jgi:tripartite-type tricarboxylate transporter receptor subunit TctC
MTLPRRKFLHLAAGAAALPALSRAARADTYPSHPVRVLVGFAAGSTTDILGRLIGQWLSQRLGQQFVVENRPGAGGNVAAEEMIKSTPDGYTLYMVPPAVAANAALYPHLNFVFLRDATAVAGVVRVPNVAEVNPSLPVNSIPELIAYAKANPGKLYRGDGPAMVDLIAGQVQVGFATMTASIGHIRSGQLRALAVTTLKRSDALPGVPTVAETVPGFEASSWFGIAAPNGTPADIVALINRETNAGLADPTIKARLDDMGGMALTGSPADFGKLIADETEKWGKVIRDAGIKAE